MKIRHWKLAKYDGMIKQAIDGIRWTNLMQVVSDSRKIAGTYWQRGEELLEHTPKEEVDENGDRSKQSSARTSKDEPSELQRG